MSTASPVQQGAPAEPSEDSRPTNPLLGAPPPAPARDVLSTLDEEDFDFHDTIPAPPWLDEALDVGGDPIEPTG